jgi:hypothetical protein
MNTTTIDRLISGEGMLGTQVEIDARRWGEALSAHFPNLVRAIVEFGGLKRLIESAPPPDEDHYQTVTVCPGVDCGVIDVAADEVIIAFSVRFKCLVASFYSVPRLNWRVSPWQAYGGSINGKGPLNENVDMMMAQLVDYAVGLAMGDES